MISGFYLGSGIGHEFRDAAAFGSFCHEGTHAILEFLKNVFSFLEPVFEVIEGTKH